MASVQNLGGTWPVCRTEAVHGQCAELRGYMASVQNLGGTWPVCRAYGYVARVQNLEVRGQSADYTAST